MNLELMDSKSKILRTKCELYDFKNPPFDIQEFGFDMIRAMHNFNGIGLAAPQVGYGYQIFVMGVNLTKIVVNPVWNPVGTEIVKNFEGCLSFPGLSLKVKRYETINVQYQTETGETVIETLSGLESRCFQHEYDHITGVCFDERVNKVDLRIARSKIPSIL